MVSVTARKIRELGTERPSGANGRIYTGYLISYPFIGRCVKGTAASIR